MSIERDVINLTGSTNPVTDLAKKEYEAKMTEVLSRGILSDQLNVQLPDDVHGEWVLNEPVNLANKRILGFEIDDKYAKGNALHSDASGAPIVGDTVFMTIPKWKHEIFQKVRQKKYDEHHGLRTGKSAEEKNFKAMTDRNEMPAVDTGVTRKLDLASINSGE